MSRSALLGETGRIPVSVRTNLQGATRLGERQSRMETNAQRGRAITPSSAAVPVKLGGKWINDDGTMVIQTVGWPSTVLIPPPSALVGFPVFAPS